MSRTTRWFTADPHLGHGNVLIGPRGDAFPDIEGWNKHILGEMRKCGENGELFILGDLSISRPEQWVQKLPKSTVLIHGNHDGSHGRCLQAFGQRRFFQTREVKIGDKPNQYKCWLSHYSHCVWPSSHHGAFHLYGHTHAQREDSFDQWLRYTPVPWYRRLPVIRDKFPVAPERRSMDVSPESVFRHLGEFRPISEYEIIDILGQRSGHDPVSFYKEYRGEYE